MTTTLHLTEGGTLEANLDPLEYSSLVACDFVDVRPTLVRDQYVLVAGRKVGAISIGGRQIIVRPKITDLNRLIFLLGYTRRPAAWRNDRVHLQSDEDLLPALADAFSRIASHALARGLLKGYRTVREDLPMLRGRLLASEQMNRRFGLPLPLAVEYDDYSVDIPENQLLLTATLRLLSVPGLSSEARHSLLRIRRTLGDVSPVPRGTLATVWIPGRLNTRYHDALHLAEIVLAAQSFEQQAGSLAVTGFVFDMWKVFEDFVCTALGIELEKLGGHCGTQWTVYLDDASQVAMRPDLLWFNASGSPRAVIDAKYKAERPSGFPYADLYQLVAYCTALSLSTGHLIYAKGTEPQVSHQIRNAELTIHCNALDLSLSPGKLLASIAALATTIAAQEDPIPLDEAPAEPA